MRVLDSARRVAAGLVVTTLAVVGPFGATAAKASGTSTISGTAFQDLNRDGVQEAGEAPFSGHIVYLYDGTASTYLGSATTDANGHYSFSGLSGGTYVLQYEGSTWDSLRDTWVPTTTGSLYPKLTVSVTGSATANFGWRQIVRSASSPISSYVGSNGLTVQSYDDVVSASSLYNDLMSGSMVGKEAAYETIQFDLGTTNVTTTSVAQQNGQYVNYSAVSSLAYRMWLDSGDEALFHEYGHAWSLYYAYIVQQDPSLAGYLQARGLSGNPNVGSSYMWDAREMIAEDYRELFGTPTAQAPAQMNYQTPPASQVAGLATYLSTAFKQPPAMSVTISSPAPGATVSGTVAVTGSAAGAPASVAVSIDGGPFGSATGTTSWSYSLNTQSFTNGTHTLTAKATSATGATATAQTSINVANRVAVTGLAMSPAPVKSSGTTSFSISMPATVTVTIKTSGGSLVNTLLSGATEGSGTISASWNRTSSSGKRVASGTYVATVVATDAYGYTATSSVSFSVQ